MRDNDDNSDRRRAERVPVNEEFGRMSAQSYVSDLSEHGVFVHTNMRVPMGATLTVRFTVLLDDPVVIEARGRVVRTSDEPAGIGVEFTHMSPDMALRLGDAMTRQRPRDLGAPLAVPAAIGSPAASDPDATVVKLAARDLQITDHDDGESAP